MNGSMDASRIASSDCSQRGREASAKIGMAGSLALETRESSQRRHSSGEFTGEEDHWAGWATWWTGRGAEGYYIVLAGKMGGGEWGGGALLRTPRPREPALPW